MRPLHFSVRNRPRLPLPASLTCSGGTPPRHGRLSSLLPIGASQEIGYGGLKASKKAQHVSSHRTSSGVMFNAKL
ncbi:hypothetical protein FKM82_030249 [Ascaphus truei]